jgi:hypothetical protein
MKLQTLLFVVAVLFGLATTASAQESVPKAGQALYVVAVKDSKQPDLQTERKIKNEFKKHKLFNIATSLESADFVFLAVVEYEFNQVMINNIGAGVEDVKSVAAFVVSLGEYVQHKNDFYNLRDKALWQTSQNNNARRTNNMPRKVVDKFHEDAAPKKL